MKKLKVDIKLFLLAIFLANFSTLSYAADPDQNIINQQDWITRQQQNKIEEDRRLIEQETIRKERSSKKKEAEEEGKKQTPISGKPAECFPIKSIALVDANSVSRRQKKKLTSPFIGKCKDLNLTGAAILSDNLALAVTGNTNKKELQDSYYSESMSISASTSIAVGGNQATVPGTGGQPNQSPGGSTTISGSYAQNESSRTVYATIGGLDSTLTSATKDVTGGDFEGSLTLDHRLFSESGRNQIGKELNQSIEVGKIVLPKVWASPNTALGLTLGGVGYLYGAATGQDVKVSIGNNAVQFEGNPLASGGAITLGNAINYFGSARTNSVYPTYESNNENWSGGAAYDSVILGGHEVKHTYQAEMLGPLFLPTYFFSGVGGAAVNGVITINPVNQYNPMERSADIVGNQSLKQQKNEN